MRPSGLVLVVGFVLGAGWAAAQPKPANLFSEANEYFRNANEVRDSDPQQAREFYQRAARRYESLISEVGVRNSKLHYNLGNAYFQLEDTGRAILHYLIAERLDPNDANVARNLAFARETRIDRLEATQGGAVLETLLFWHYDLSGAVRVRIFAVMWVCFWGLLLLRKAGREWVPREIAFGLGAVAALMLGSLAYDAAAASQTVTGVVIVPEAVARQGDGLSYEPAFEDPLHAGAEFRVLEERPDWHRVELPDGRRCWLSDQDIDLVR